MLSAKGIITFAIAGIAAIFLSSVVPVGAVEKPYICTPAQAEAGECLPLINNPFSGARSFDVTMEKDFPTTWQPPVLYTDFDISKALEPWQEIMINQLAIWTYDREVARNKQLELLGMPPEFGGWLMNSLGMFILLSGLAGLVILWYIWIDWRKKNAA